MKYYKTIKFILTYLLVSGLVFNCILAARLFKYLTQ